MRLNRLLVSLLLSVSLAAMPATVLAAATPAGDWSVVMAVPVGERLEVELKVGRPLKGELADVTDAGLRLTRKGQLTQVERENVSRVYRVTGRAHAKSTMVGAGLGAGLGVAAGIALTGAVPVSEPSARERALVAGGLGLVFGGVGALVGYAVSKKKKRVLIYQAA